VIMDHDSPGLQPLSLENAVSNLVYCASRHDVRTVLCDGEVLMLDRHPLTMDLGEVIEEGRKAMEKMVAHKG
jgi:cytosine/adenosine deaminase-related metal-dependent hydrolase